ncbi:MAG: hypothetical protein ACI35W_03460 [Anaeroplasmataceae bacterium]
MSCECQNSRHHECLEENEICCCGQLYQFSLVSGGRSDSSGGNSSSSGNTKTLLVTPCDQPTAIFDVATITTKSNSCMDLTYFQAVVNTDPVEIIQDCNLRNTICRTIELYMRNNSCGCGCSRTFDDDRCANRRGFNLF